jgi:serine/threonine protein kinase/predicted negative regulator of RcsB-dependent stress response
VSSQVFSTQPIGRGTRLGRFTVTGELGAGGMGIVYSARDTQLDREVALKVMRVASADEQDRVRMMREGQAMARVTHPNVITVFEVGTEDGLVFLAQELLDAGTLSKWLEIERPRDQVIAKFIAAGRGLAAAHAVGLVHRDFKPDNVLLGKDGRVRVADFGLARDAGTAIEYMSTQTPVGGAAADYDSGGVLSAKLTRTGIVMGTPMFMAPEQHEGRPADARSDQFAFCVALYEALYNDWPYAGKTSVALADNVINGVMKPVPSGADVPARLRKVLLRGLATKPDDRYPSMDALLADLAEPVKKRNLPLMLLGGAIIVAGGAAASILLLDRAEPPKMTDVITSTEKVVPKDNDRTFDPKEITTAMDLGQLGGAYKSFDDDARLMADPAMASRARSASALLFAMQGDLKSADARLADAAKGKGTDLIAGAYMDMAGAWVAWAKGDLKGAIEKSQRCAKTLSSKIEGEAPIELSICYQTEGDAEADRGNAVAARAAYDKGLVLANQIKDAQRISEIKLAIASLEFDDKQDALGTDEIEALKRDAHRRGAPSAEATAAILLARIQLAKADPQKAMDVFDDIGVEAMQSFRARTIAKLTIGEIYGYRGEADDNGVLGTTRIDEAQADAQRSGFTGLVFEARLAKVQVEVITSTETCEADRKQLVEDARAKGYKRVANLANAFNHDAAPAPAPTTPPAAPPVTPPTE